MPIYLDTHEGTDLPMHLRTTISRRVQEGSRDPYGVIDRGVLIDRVAGQMHCILEAPDVEAVMRHHESLQVPLARETVHETEAIL